MREDGYYWVKVDSEFFGQWVIAKLVRGKQLWFCGEDFYVHIVDADEIGDKIEREE